MPTTSQGTSAPTQRTRELICRFESPAKLLETFNPDRQIDFTRDVRRAYLGAAPTLSAVSEAFAEGTAKAWVAVQLWNLAEFSGCKNKLSQQQIDELAQVICTDYCFLKLTELMHFFRKFKSGTYGKFYGSVDPMVITCALREYMRDRNALLAEYDRQERAAKAANDPEHRDYMRRYNEGLRARRFYSYNFRSTDFTYEEFSELWWLFNLTPERTDHGYVE